MGADENRLNIITQNDVLAVTNKKRAELKRPSNHWPPLNDNRILIVYQFASPSTTDTKCLCPLRMNAIETDVPGEIPDSSR